MPNVLDETTGKPRTAILVLGMHRSGTSAVTRVMNILGAALPERLMPKAAANPVGHFEPMEIVTIHDRLLTSADTSWADWSAFPEPWYRSNSSEAFLDELVDAVSTDYAGSDLFLVKDPRILRFVPLWLKVLKRLDIASVAVLPFRNPIEVALSLNTRDGFPREHGYLLWLRHVLDAEFQSRGMPRTFLSYDRLLEHKQTTTYRLIEALPLTWPRKTARAFEEIGRFLDTKLRRSTAARSDLSLHADVPEQVRIVYEAYERLEDDPQDPAAMERLDAVRTEFDRTSGVMAATFKALRKRFEEDRTEATILAERFAMHERAVEANARTFEDESRAMRGDMTSLRDAFDLSQNANQALRADAERARVQTHALQQDMISLRADADRERERIDALRQGMHSLHEDADREREQIDALRQGMHSLHEDARRTLEEIDSLRQRRDDLQREAEAARAERDTLREITDRQWLLLRKLQDNLTRFQGDLRYADYRSAQEGNTRWWHRPTRDPDREAKAELVLRSGLFDPEWYRQRYLANGSADAEPLDHFIDVGSRLAHSPGPFFDAPWYVQNNPDVAENQVEPFFHYLAHGVNEGRQPYQP